MPFDPDLGRVAPSNVNLTVLDGWRVRETGLHPAVDIPMPVGTPILAAADGIATRVVPTDSSDAGIFVALTHPSGLVSRYLHLSKVLVAQGQQVAKGDQIGVSGQTGAVTGPHLHFDLGVPASLLPAINEAVGTPTTGFNPDFGFGTVIPVEPWLPVDGYTDAVVANARALGIPLFRDRVHAASTAVSDETNGARSFFVGAGVVIGLIGLSWLALRVAKHAAHTLGRPRPQRMRYGDY